MLQPHVELQPIKGGEELADIDQNRARNPVRHRKLDTYNLDAVRPRITNRKRSHISWRERRKVSVFLLRWTDKALPSASLKQIHLREGC